MEFVHKEWLQHWLKDGIPNGDSFREVIDNRTLLCQHNKICLTKISDLKCVPADTASKVWAKCDRNPQLLTDDLCRQCVRDKIVSVKRANQIQEDAKEIQDILKIGSLESSLTYYVGLFSFKNWKELANEELEWKDVQKLKEEEKKDHEKGKIILIDSSPVKVVPIESEDIKPPDESLAKIDSVHELIEVPESESAPATSSPSNGCLAWDAAASPISHRHLFNSEIVCQHGNLMTDISLYRYVPYHVWRILKKYFKNAAEFKVSQEACPICRVSVPMTCVFALCARSVHQRGVAHVNGRDASDHLLFSGCFLSATNT